MATGWLRRRHTEAQDLSSPQDLLWAPPDSQLTQGERAQRQRD
jgi:hypothetical protein